MIDANRLQYDEETKVLARLKIQVTRGEMDNLPTGNYIKGLRFRDVDYILATLESLSSQRDFLEFPFATVMDALLEVASADYWYQREKDYGEDDASESWSFGGPRDQDGTPDENSNDSGC